MVMLSSFPPPTEGIRLTQPSTGAYINSKDLGRGTLYIAESRVSWVNDASGQGFSLEYPHVSLHAISRDLSAFPHECLYLMLDSQLEEPEAHPENEDSDAESETQMTEVRFVPEDRGLLEAMFHAMSVCQTLHPDANDSFSSEETDSDDGDDEGEYSLANAEGEEEEGDVEEMETGQFEDADPEH